MDRGPRPGNRQSVRFPQAGDTIPLGAERGTLCVIEMRFVDDDAVFVVEDA